MFKFINSYAAITIDCFRYDVFEYVKVIPRLLLTFYAAYTLKIFLIRPRS